MRRVIRFCLAVVAVLTFGGQTPAADAFAELQAYRQANGLPAHVRDEGLSRAAEAAVQYRAARGIWGHVPGTPGDFQFLPKGVHADAAGCNLEPGEPGVHGILACGLRDDHREAGAAVTTGPDGRVYWHVFYRGGSGRELLPTERSVPPRPYTPVRTAIKAAVQAVKPTPKPAAKADCNCGDGCKCAPGSCPGACPKPDGPVAAEIVARCRKGEVFVREVKAGDVPNVPAGVYQWRQVPDGRIRYDRVNPAPVANPFAVPGCATGRCGPTR